MKEEYQSFNYHTHTKRCSHASIYEDTEYLYYARTNGINAVGFSCHVPFNPLRFPDIKSRMVYSDIDEYISSINKLKKDNPDMCILCGFECEYYPEIEEYLGSLRNKVDYLIMGEHFVNGINPNTKDYPLIYADMVVKGIESGLFDIIAHPDIFIRNRSNLSIEDKEVFDLNTIKAGIMIGEKAKEYGIPLELNVKYTIELGSEVIPFWQEISKLNTKVLFGLDAHDPKEFNEFHKKRVEVLSKLNMKFNFVNKNYNPIVARLQNQKLSLNYQIRQSKVDSIYTWYASDVLSGVLDSVTKYENINEVRYFINEGLSKEQEKKTMESSKKDEESFNRIDTINKKDCSNIEKSYLLSRVRDELGSTNRVLSNVNSLINDIKSYVSSALDMGVNNSEELFDVVLKLVELKYSNNQSKKRYISMYLDNLENSLGGVSNSSKLVKVNPSFGEFSEEDNVWNGFVSKLSLILFITFFIGFGVGVAYILMGI